MIEFNINNYVVTGYQILSSKQGYAAQNLIDVVKIKLAEGKENGD